MATILVVEDDAGMRAWLAEILEPEHQVVTARDGREARSMAKRHQPDPVITDISMPDEDGLGLIRSVRSDRPEVKIIAISGKHPDHLMDARIMGAHATLSKPVTAKQVLQCEFPATLRSGGGNWAKAGYFGFLVAGLTLRNSLSHL